MPTFRQERQLFSPLDPSHYPAMYHLPADKRWIDDKAAEIAARRVIPLPIASSEAMAEWERIQQRPKAGIVSIKGRTANRG